MKTKLFFGAGIAAAALASGCVGISIGNREGKAPSNAPVVIVATEPGDQAAIAEVNAAAGLSMDNARRDALLGIAQRTNLAPPVQVHLANTAFKKLDFDNNKVAVLEALIRNPAFCPPAKQTIMTQLNRLGFDRDRQALLNAVNQRETK
jgi:hypothetical protein